MGVELVLWRPRVLKRMSCGIRSWVRSFVGYSVLRSFVRRSIFGVEVLVVSLMLLWLLL